MRLPFVFKAIGVGALLAALAGAASAQSMRLLQAQALRADRQSTSAAQAQLAAGQVVELQQLAGGWAQVRWADRGAATQLGWVRASALDLGAAAVGAASQQDTGRLAAGNTAVPLGIRALPARANRHALIVGVGQYQVDAARPVPALAGVQHDMNSALAMARQLQIPTDNITLLRDAGASREGVQQALRELEARLQPGDRVFVYWSGHGSRYYDEAEGGCVETLVPHDLRDISNKQFGQWLQPLARKTEKLMVVYDACHSGGVGAAASATLQRSLPAGAQQWFPKSATPGQAICNQPSNVRNRSLESATRSLGIDGQDVVHLSSSRPDEVSFDNPARGGLATYALRQCLGGEAKDLDGSGAISMDELAACAQGQIDKALAGQNQVLPHHVVLSGNRGFVPAWFAAPSGQVAPSVTAPAVWAAAPATPAAPAAPVVASAPAVQAPVPVQQVLAQIHAQRDSKRRVSVVPTSDRLKIGRDQLDLAITSSHEGHVYVAMLGSDGQSLLLLFPNQLDSRNHILAGQTLNLPREAWRVGAGGPPGRNTVLVMVTDGPRDLGSLGGGQVGPFVQPLTDAQGRARLSWLLGQRTQCSGTACSDAFGSALLTVSEY
jgi:hypothetical protein